MLKSEDLAQVGTYIIEEEIGRGGTSRVFRETREHLGGRVRLAPFPTVH
ncbi:MAG: hypothetical protein RJQ07_02645 [Pseudomonadales bacterium]